MTTALQARIEREAEEKRQAAWAERGKQRIQNPRWAVITLIRTGQLSSAQYDAAMRYASCIERSMPGGGGGVERVDGGSGDMHARLWDQAVCSQIVRDGRRFVLSQPTTLKTRVAVFDKLFALPLPTMNDMRKAPGGDRYPAEFAVRRISSVLDLLDLFWTERDRAYGR